MLIRSHPATLPVLVPFIVTSHQQGVRVEFKRFGIRPILLYIQFYYYIVI